jgi:uncharacterized protein (TIGR02145 family)
MKNTIIKDYQVKSELGQGGMAKVYLAHDIKFQTNVAIKVLNKEYVHNDNIRKRFIAEARNMFKMSHPNIIKVTDLIDDGDTVAFVMEYIEGETLKEYLDRKGKLSDDEIKNLFSQMLEAVGYVHDKKLVHRDIKPSNFMINSEGQVKLLDFGIAKNIDIASAEYTQTGTGIQMGTPMYMSPEQVTETKSVTSQSDIYSLGVVLWQMVTGRKPYNTNTLSSFQLQMKIVQEDLPSTKMFWDRIIKKSTDKEVSNRYFNCLEIKNILEKPVRKSKSEGDKTIVSNYNEKTVVENRNNINKNKIKSNTNSIKEDKIIIKNDIKRKKKPIETTEKNVKFLDKKPQFLKDLFFAIIFASIIFFGGLKILSIVFSEDIDIDEIRSSNKEIKINNTTWSTKNLNVKQFANGDNIIEAKTNEEWIKANENKQPAWCYYENNLSNEEIYGKLYNYYAVIDKRGLAPNGWKVSSHYDWKYLIDECGGVNTFASKFKTKSGWKSSKFKSGNGVNEIGCNALPGGYRDNNGIFRQFGSIGSWWSIDLDKGGVLFISCTDKNSELRDGYKKFGFSVRVSK